MFNVLIGLLLGLMSSAALSQPSLEAVTAATPVIKTIGLEVVPPHGDHWFYYRQHPPGQVTFRKQDPAKKTLQGGTYLSFLVEIKAENYRDHDLTTASGLESALAYALYEDPDRYKYGNHRFEKFAWQGTDCIRYAMSREQPGTIEGKSLVFRWDVEGYFCRHPSSPMVAVTGLFQEQRLPETPSMLNDTLRNEAEQVLKSVRFLQIK